MKQQILDILNELEKWRSVRKLSIESQREGYIRNIMEELGELAEAIKVEQNWETMSATMEKYPLAFLPETDSEDPRDNRYSLERSLLLKYYGTDAYIDALCDIMVFAGNCVYKEKFDKTNVYWENVETPYSDESETTLLKCLLESSVNIAHSPSQEIAMLYSFCRDLATKKGYDFFKCMQEVLKQINSRTGAWNEDLKKWVKDTSPEAKSKEYQANFYRCKLS